MTTRTDGHGDTAGQTSEGIGGEQPQPQQPPRYPAWALVHDPANAAVARAAGEEMARAGELTGPRPGPALEEFQRIEGGLPDDHLPAYWEEVARLFLAVGRDKQAAMMFGRARAADQHATLERDPAERHAVFLEFALAGALSAKDIKAYADELAEAPDPAEAYRAFRELAVRRTLGGLPPWPGMLKQTGRLAKRAGLHVVTEHRLLLEELAGAPALWQAADGFWTTQRAQLLPAVAASERLRALLPWKLTTLPSTDLDGWWCMLLEDAGALDGLTGSGADETRGGVTAWLSAMLARYAGPSAPPVPDELLHLIPLLADRIREAEKTPVRFDAGDPDAYHSIDAAALHRCLDAGVPVADPGPKAALRNWRASSVDLRALMDDERFGPVLVRSVPTGGAEFRGLWGAKPLRPVVRGIIDERLREAASGGLEDAIMALRWLDDNARAACRCGTCRSNSPGSTW